MFFQSFAMDLIAKATLMLLGVVALDRLLVQRVSAAVRHRLWSLAFIALLLLPLLSLTVPTWRLAVLPNDWVETETAPASVQRAVPINETPRDFGVTETPAPLSETSLETQVLRPPADLPSLSLPNPSNAASESMPPQSPAPVVEETTEQASFNFSWTTLLMSSWAAGVALALAPLAFGWTRNRRLRSESTVIRDQTLSETFESLRERLRIRGVVQLLESPRGIVPMTWGTNRPIVMIPSAWREWPEESQRLVLLHELAHVKRRDVVYQTLARFACAAFWFHPLVWYALRRLRIERELACDDCVLMAGEVPSNYASELVNIAKRYQVMVMPPAVAMAQRSGLESRIRSLLDKARSHVPVSPRVARVLLCGVLFVATLLAAIRLEATEKDNAESAETAGQTKDVSSVSRTISGKVVDENGRALADANVVVVRRFQANTDWTNQFEKLGTTTTDENGRYSIDVPRYSRRFSDGRNFERQSINVIATKPGHGLDQYDVDALNSHAEPLRLGSTTNGIEGRIVDLEGNALPNVEVRFHEIAVAAHPIDDWLEEAVHNPSSRHRTAPTSMAGGSDAQKLAYFPQKYPSIGAIDPLDFAPTKTDGNGRFRLPPVGDDQLVTLRIDGPGIASTYLQVVPREMPSINMPMGDPRYRSGKIYGNDFTYSVAPSQVIQGQITDRATGEPLAGVTVSLDQFPDNLLGVSDFLSTVTDASGRYTLKGVPKASKDSNGVRLEFTPSAELPYFRCTKRIPKGSGLAAIEYDVQLTKAIWIEGTVSDNDGKPVRGMVAYYPNLDNQHAEGHESFRKNTYGMGYGDGYPTDENGHFRIPGMPGRGALRVVAENSVYFETQEPAPRSLNTESRGEANDLYHIMMPGNQMPRVTVPDGAEEHHVDVKLTRRATRTINVVDAEGRPVEGFHVAGIFPIDEPTIGGAGHRYEMPELIQGSVFDVVLGSSEAQARPLIVTHRSSRTAAVLDQVSLIADANEPLTLTLKPMATVRGRLTNFQERHLIAGHGEIEDIVLRSMNSSGKVQRSQQKHLKFRFTGRFTINEDGTFEFALPPCSKLSLFYPGKNYRVLLNQAMVTAGEAIDVGVIDVAGVQSPVAETETKPAPSNPKNAVEELRFRGSVVDPRGQPVTGAKLHFVYWHEGEPRTEPLAVSGPKGHFDFSVPQSDYEGTRGQVWRYMKLVAFKPGFGVALKRAIAFESSGKRRIKNPALAMSMLTTLTMDNVLRLVPDDQAIEGKIVTLDAQPVEGASVTVREIWRNSSESLTAWEKAAQSPKADYYSLRQTVSEISNGPMIPSIIPGVTTDKNGRFSLRGIGRNRIVELLVSGPNIETVILKARTRDGETVKVPNQFGLESSQLETYHARTFTHVAAPSKTVEGKLSDATTSDPIPNVMISAGARTAFSLFGKQHIATRSGTEGTYILAGLGKRDETVFFVPPSGSRYLPQGVQLPPSSNANTIKQDLSLKQVPLLRGRITDDRTGQPIPAAIQYFADVSNESLADHPGFARSSAHEVLTDSDGRYVISALPGRGFLTVMALDHTKYKRAKAFSTTADVVQTAPSWLLPSNYHHVETVEIQSGPAESADQEINVTLGSGVSLSARVVDAKGEPVTDFVYYGQTGVGGWRPARDGKLIVDGYYENRPRELIVFHRKTNSVALTKLKGKVADSIVIQLQPAATIRGRLLNDQGLPLRNTEVFGPGIVRNHFGDPDYRWTTDEQGRFEVPGILPERPYTLSVLTPQGAKSFASGVTALKPSIEDLGEITLK